ncbi:MAG TPA: energy transducer TonB [Gammaproteobacteria bacterium]
MMAIRLPLAALFGGTFTLSMFWLLWHLVSGPLPEAQTTEARRIEFTRMRRDTEVQTRREEKVEREQPPPTPEVPRMSISTGSLDNNVAQLTPVVDARSAMSRLTLTPGSDTDVIPLVRIAPEYPPRALSRGIEGWVQVQFTITPTGTVKDPVVVNADPKGVFEDAALRAISRWRYNPKIEGGVAVERVGVQTIIRFQLEQ